MRGLFSIIALAMVFVFTACQSESAPKAGDRVEAMTSDSFTYVIHATTAAAKPQLGELAVYEFDVFQQGQLVNTSRTQPVDPGLMIEQTDSLAQPNPIMEMLANMCVGDSATMYVPLSKIPGARGPVDDTILYNIVLKEITDSTTYSARVNEYLVQRQQEAASYQERAPEVLANLESTIDAFNAGTLENVQTTDTGLKYLVVEQGDGDPASAGSIVSVHYYGALTADKSSFDNSFQKGNPLSGLQVGSGQVIQGWDQGIPLFNNGGKGYLFIPSELGYGATGSGERIPPNSELCFYIEVTDVMNMPN